MKHKFVDFNFNLVQMKKDFISKLNGMEPFSFLKVHRENSDELLRCVDTMKTRIVEIVVLNTGRVSVTLERKNIESFFCSKSHDEEQEGMTMDQFEKILPDLKDFLKTGRVNKEHFEKSPAEPDDWADPIFS